MLKRPALITLALTLLAACASVSSQRLTVLAASSLTNAFIELAAAYDAEHPGLNVDLSFGASSTLAFQILEGAPADIFASANPAQMQAVVEAGLVAAPPRTFASNQLVLIVPADNPAAIHAFSDLANPGLSLILAAPGVPARQYSDLVIAHLGDAAFQAAVYANLASEEANVRLVATKVALGEADAGIVYTTDITPNIANQVLAIPIPPEANAFAYYPIAPLSASAQPAAAADFIKFLLSPEGQAILARWGFGPAP
ncbi:MAG: molybdate ABC transporter substrate-binding protein [Chloroflexi bacterium]|nr:molybdate ABC transporter substrate-binding protein [Chloroflexota bacterium]